MTAYYKIRLGKGAKHAKECLASNFIGVDYRIHQDLSGQLPTNWSDFNEKFIPIYLANNPGKGKVAAGLACGMIWTVAKGIAVGDTVLCPDSTGQCHVGEITSGYVYHPGPTLPHRRPVRWYDRPIEPTEMSATLQASIRSIGTVANISKHSEEIQRLLYRLAAPNLTINDETIEDPSIFAMEKHLEEFLVANWAQTELGDDYDIYTEDGDLMGQQF